MLSKIPSKKSNGFSLIELMIVVAILGIIMGIAIPSYSGYMEKVRRADATSFLIEVASEQVRFFSEYNRFTEEMDQLGYENQASALSHDGYYEVSTVTSDSDTTYVLTATPVAGGQQDGDTECASFTLSSSNLEDVTGSEDPDYCW